MLGDENISVSLVKSELGLTTTSAHALCSDDSINKWSFYRPRPIHIVSNAIAFDTPDFYKLGDFRRYDHAAIEPTCSPSFEINYLPSATNVTVEIDVDLKRFNILEAIPSVTPYLCAKFYSSTSDRTGRTNAQHTTIVLVDLKEEIPPAGHSNNQEEAPDSPQLIEDATVPVSAISAVPNGYLYAETYISDVSGSLIMELPDGGYTDIECNRLVLPRVLAYGPEFELSGYDTVYIFANNSSSSTVSEDVPMDVNTDNASFYFFVVGQRDGTGYRLGASAFSGKIVVGLDEYTLNATELGNGTSNKLESTTDFWGTDDLWSYGDVGVIEIVSISGVIEGDEVSLT